MNAPSNLPFDPTPTGSTPPPAPIPPKPPAPPAAPMSPSAVPPSPSIGGSPRPMTPPPVTPPKPMMPPPAPAPKPPAPPMQIVTPPPSVMNAPLTPPSPTMRQPLSQPPSAKKGEPEDIFSNLEQPRKIVDRMTPPTGAAKGSGGAIKYIIIILAVLIGLGAIGFGFWFFVVRGSVKAPELPSIATPSDTDSNNSPTNPDGKGTTSTPVVPPLDLSGSSSSVVDVNATSSIPVPVTTPPEGANIPLPGSTPSAPPEEPVTPPAPPVDTDKDGLTDQRESELGTDPNKADTDGDEVNDGDEVIKYGTNPLNKDTDGDGYADGSEIQKGYNPRGPGKCLKQDCSI